MWLCDKGDEVKQLSPRPAGPVFLLWIQGVLLTRIDCDAHPPRRHSAGSGKHTPTDQYLECTGPAVKRNPLVSTFIN